MKLIYHLLPDTNSKNKKRSPFDIAISELVKCKSIQVACPYIGVKYFKDIIINGCRDWELLTDVNALIESHRNGDQIEEITSFLEEFSKKIKHQDNLHAKVIIAEDRALIGSANFTKEGVCNNNEMSVIISGNDIEKVNEIKRWYNEWWQHATKLTQDRLIKIKDEVKKNINSIEIVNKRNNVTYISSSKKIKTIYGQKSSEHIETDQKIEEDLTKINYNIDTIQIENDAKKIAVDKDDEEKLIECLEKWDDKIYTEQFFDLAQYIIGKFNIREQDERLSVSIRIARYRISVKIGRRYILASYWQHKDIGLIMPLEFNQENALLDGRVNGCLEFKDGYGETEAYEIYYRKIEKVKFNDITMLEWEMAVKDELKRSTRSNWRNKHQPTVYKFICDKEYRNTILNEVYKN